MKDSKLTKAEIIENVYERTKHDKKDIHEIFDIILNVIKEGLCDNRIVELRGFGTFEVRIRKGRETAHNPKTGKIVSVKPHGVALFRAGKELKDSVWKISKK